jgi:hypothetical protein
MKAGKPLFLLLPKHPEIKDIARIAEEKSPLTQMYARTAERIFE